MVLDNSFLQMVQENLAVNFIYDVLKFIIAFIFVKFFYEKVYIKWKWGGWRVIILNEDRKQVVSRKLSCSVTKRIFEDLGEFSIYLKGIISPYGWLNNIDIASEKAEGIGLIERDYKNKMIIIDLSKNPSK